jgi:hypothetical protein
MIITLDLHDTNLPNEVKNLFDDVQLGCEVVPEVGDCVDAFTVIIDFIDEFISDEIRNDESHDVLKGHSFQLRSLKVKARLFTTSFGINLNSVSLIF